jgi:hypothetical protein
MLTAMTEELQVNPSNSSRAGALPVAFATKSTTMGRPEAQIGGKFALMSPPGTGGIASSTRCPSFAQSFAAASRRGAFGRVSYSRSPLM